MSPLEARPSILIAADECADVRNIALQLRNLGYQVLLPAPEGMAAVALAARLEPALVLIAIRENDPAAAIAAARSIREQCSIPVVFMAAFCADDLLAGAGLGEPFGYICQPIAERALRAIVEMALYKHRAELLLTQKTQQSQAILDTVVDSVINIDARGIIVSFNAAASVLFGYAPHAVVGQNVSMLMPEPHSSHHDRYLKNYRSSGEEHIIGHPRELQGRRQDGSVFHMHLTVSRVNGAQPAEFIGVIGDLTRRHADDDAFRRMAYHDLLTGLPNRRQLINNLTAALSRANGAARHGAVMFLNLDYFKQINDSLGQAAGDALLVQVASRLQQCVRSSDGVARTGGDTFVVLLEALSAEQQDAAKQAQDVAHLIISRLRDAYLLDGQAISCTASIGIAMFSGAPAESIDELLKMADIAMYQAKSAGRDTVCFYDFAMQAAASARFTLEQDLRQGLLDDAFMLAYQVQVDREGATTGVEALVRWQHPLRGMVSPAEFIPLAEETGLILALGQWVLTAACTQLVKWCAHPATAHWTVAVNVSALEFVQASFVASVTSVLRLTGANPRLLKLELTESMLVEDVEGIITKMNAIKALGVTFSLDDFGTGYSALCYLKRLPIEQLKIDQSFVRELLTGASDAAIVHAILALGHSLGLKVIAEGVETSAQRDLLSAMGCDAYQGYFFGRPVAAGDLRGATPN